MGLALFRFHAQSMVEKFLATTLGRLAEGYQVAVEHKVDTKGSDYLSEVRGLASYKAKAYIKATFSKQQHHSQARNALKKLITDNQSFEQNAAQEILQEPLDTLEKVQNHYRELVFREPLHLVEEIFEADIDPLTRFLIDADIRCGLWYQLTSEDEENSSVSVSNTSVFLPSGR